jgi:hypothetical protein
MQLVTVTENKADTLSRFDNVLMRALKGKVATYFYEN